MNLGLAGKRALVTGGTRGIGRAIVHCLADEGCHVALCARDGAMVLDTVAALRAKGVEACGSSIDVSIASQLVPWVDTVAETLGGIDIVVANASALAVEPTDASWQKGFDVDVMGAVRTVDTARTHLEKSDAGSIVIISSTAALEIYAGMRPYNSIKAALTSYVAGLSQEFAPAGVRVNAVSPGAIYFDGGVWQRLERERPEAYHDMLERNPLGRLGRPEEIARAVAFVASPAASFMTGSNIVVDGGMTRRIQY